MSPSRKSFVAGTAMLGMISALSGAAIADTGERAVMLTLWVAPKNPAHSISITSQRTLH